MDAVLFVKLVITGGDEFLFTKPSETIEQDAIPSLDGVSVSAAVLDPGRSIGQRETVTARFVDHLYQFDAEAYDAGTFWTKFRAIYETIQGSRLYVYRGERGAALADMERRTYVVDSLKISRSGAAITAKDPLSLVLGKSAQAPTANSGELDAAIAAGDGSLTLAPSGIGDLEYPASGRGCIGGSEIVSFTRSGDAVTLTARGENLGGVGEDHDEGSKFQLVLEYDGASPSEIVNDLLTNYTNVDASWITLSDWTSVDDHVGHLYQTQIAAPESVTKLLDELSEQVGMTLYWDAVAEKLRLISLAPPAGSFAVSDDNMIADSFDVDEQPDKRVTRIWVDYAQRNPALRGDEQSNYRRGAVNLADNAGDYEQDSIKRIQSRWIGINNGVAAERLTDMQIARYKIPPRKFRFELFRNEAITLPRLGAGVTVSNRRLVDADGALVTISAVVVSESGQDDRVEYEAEEINYDGAADTTKLVVIDSTSGNIDLRTLFDGLYSTVGSTDDVTFIIQSGVQILGDQSYGYALTVGTWPVGVTLTLVINGDVVGLAIEAPFYQPGVAIFTDRAISIENNGFIQAQGDGIAINGWSFVTYSGSGSIQGSTVG